MLSGDLVLFIFGVFLWVFNALDIRAGRNQVVSGDSKRERPGLGGKLLNGCSDGLCVKLSRGALASLRNSWQRPCTVPAAY